MQSLHAAWECATQNGLICNFSRFVFHPNDPSVCDFFLSLYSLKAQLLSRRYFQPFQQSMSVQTPRRTSEGDLKKSCWKVALKPLAIAMCANRVLCLLSIASSICFEFALGSECTPPRMSFKPKGYVEPEVDGGERRFLWIQLHCSADQLRLNFKLWTFEL